MSRALALSVIAAMLPLPGAASAPPHVSVRFDPALGPVRGRLLVFLTQTPPKGEVEPGFIHPREVEVLGTEIDAAAGSTIEMPLDAPAYPVPLRALTPGTYTARAELDVQHDYTYDGGLPGDPDSGNVSVTIASGADTTIGVGGLRKASPPRRPPLPLPRGARWEAFVSPALSAFAGDRRNVTRRATSSAATGRRLRTSPSKPPIARGRSRRTAARRSSTSTSIRTFRSVIASSPTPTTTDPGVAR
jgi:hypothetical protein